MAMRTLREGLSHLRPANIVTTLDEEDKLDEQYKVSIALHTPQGTKTFLLTADVANATDAADEQDVKSHNNISARRTSDRSRRKKGILRYPETQGSAAEYQPMRKASDASVSTATTRYTMAESDRPSALTENSLSSTRSPSIRPSEASIARTSSAQGAAPCESPSTSQSTVREAPRRTIRSRTQRMGRADDSYNAACLPMRAERARELRPHALESVRP
eukprot:GEMP01023583.1.p1 GENE.GEMP01023583.1~~GEMP01023583.1.p1  ORF type:complete len:218 (+),score=37.82 GEMP01023583.1:310-963(+)